MSKKRMSHKVVLLSSDGKRIQKKNHTQNVVTTSSLQFSMLRKGTLRILALAFAISYIVACCIIPVVMSFGGYNISKDTTSTSENVASVSKGTVPILASTYTNTKVASSIASTYTKVAIAKSVMYAPRTVLRTQDESPLDEPELDTDGKAKPESGVETKPEAEVQTESEIGFRAEPEAKPDVYVKVEPEPKAEPEANVVSDPNSAPEAKSNFAVPPVLYLHERNVSRNSNFFWVLEVLEERVSDDDIAVDMTSLVDPSLALHFSEQEILDICKLVYAESNGQPFRGQLAVAEDWAGRYRSPYYGTDIYSIIVNGYVGELDEQGNYHVYDGNGKEILEVSESVKAAVKLALSGSQMTHRLLKAVTEYVNAKYGLQLDNKFFEYGAMYHYNPDTSDPKEIAKRTFQKMPVSFMLGRHIFYGWWLTDSMALNVTP